MASTIKIAREINMATMGSSTKTEGINIPTTINSTKTAKGTNTLTMVNSTKTAKGTKWTTMASPTKERGPSTTTTANLMGNIPKIAETNMVAETEARAEEALDSAVDSHHGKAMAEAANETTQTGISVTMGKRTSQIDRTAKSQAVSTNQIRTDPSHRQTPPTQDPETVDHPKAMWHR